MDEQYKAIKWYEWYYEVSNLWNVRSLWREVFCWNWSRYKKPSILSPYTTTTKWKKYLNVELNVEWESKQITVWKLVYRHFGKRKNKKNVYLEHIDWDYKNCKIENLRIKKATIFTPNEFNEIYKLWDNDLKKRLIKIMERHNKNTPKLI